MRTEKYIQDENGNVTLVESEDDGIIDHPKEGEVKLVPTAGGARVVVNTPYAGEFITLQREQTNVSNIGNIVIINPIPGQSFEIRSTNASDAGTIKWKLIEE